MVKKRQVDQQWHDVRRALAAKKPVDLLDAVRDLYALSQENRDFLNARFMASESRLEPYKLKLKLRKNKRGTATLARRRRGVVGK